MADPLLPQPQIQESLSRSYLRALSPRSGFITAEFDFDIPAGNRLDLAALNALMDGDMNMSGGLA